MVTIPVKHPQGIRPAKPHRRSIEQLKEEESELLTIAKHLSQAVIRMGNAQNSYDFYHQHNDALDYARRCQEELQAWMTRHVVNE